MASKNQKEMQTGFRLDARKVSESIPEVVAELLSSATSDRDIQK